MTATESGTSRLLSTGTEVEVLTRFEHHWTSGFEIASVDEEHRFLLRRQSDGAVLPASFGANQLRPRW
jgi:hypothetical protein